MRGFLNPIHLKNVSLGIIRDYFRKRGIEEVISPLMVKSGAIEPFLDSISVGKDYFLPTSPEISLKKLLAICEPSCRGIYEIAHAFRDEPSSKIHLREFTMVEWYQGNYNYLNLVNDVQEILDLLDDIVFRQEGGKNNKNRGHRIISVADLFEQVFQIRPDVQWQLQDYYDLAKAKKILSSKLEKKSKIDDIYLLNEVFTLLYDFSISEYALSCHEIYFVKDYPSFLRGMAKLSPEGWAMRIEVYKKNLELGSGYQEIDDCNELQNLWEQNNKIREYAGKAIHPLDYNLIHLTERMKGVSGMAMGLERMLMALYNIEEIREFCL